MTQAAFEPPPARPAHIRGQTNRKQAMRADLRRDLAPIRCQITAEIHQVPSKALIGQTDRRGRCAEASDVLGARLVPNVSSVQKGG